MANILTRIKDLADKEQFTHALSLLSTQRAKAINTQQQEVRELVRKICEGFIANNDQTDQLFPRRMVRLMERCHNHDWLMNYAEARYKLGDHDTAIESFTAARLHRLEDENLPIRTALVREVLTEKGTELCDNGAPISAFAYFEAAETSLLMLDEELNAKFSRNAQALWKSIIEDTRSPNHFRQQGGERVTNIFEACGRSDLLFACGKNIEDLWRTEQKHVLETGEFNQEQSWVHYALSIYKKALYLVGKEEFSLTKQQQDEIGTFLLIFGETDSAINAFVRSENAQLLRSTVLELLRSKDYTQIHKALFIIQEHNFASHREVKSALRQTVHLLTKSMYPEIFQPKNYEQEQKNTKRQEILALIRQCSSCL